MPLWSVWTAGAFCARAVTPHTQPRRASQPYAHRPPPREGARRPRARHDPPPIRTPSRLHIPVSPYKPCERVYSLERVNIPPRLLPPVLRRLCASWTVIYARRPCRPAVSRCPGSAEKGPHRSGSPSFSAQFPADFRKISDPVLKIFSASFKNRIFIFPVRNSR